MKVAKSWEHISDMYWSQTFKIQLKFLVAREKNIMQDISVKYVW